MRAVDRGRQHARRGRIAAGARRCPRRAWRRRASGCPRAAASRAPRRRGDLAARGDENHLGRAARRVRQHIGAARHAGRRRVFAAVEGRQRLARQHQHRRSVAQLQDVAVGLDHLVGVGGPQHDQARNGAQRDQLLDRLMRRTVLAVAHRVMGEDEDRRQLHQRGQPDGRPRIVAEDEERRAERPQLRQRKPVDDRRHGVLANAEMQIPAAGVVGLEIAGAGEFERGPVRGPEIGRAAQEPGDVLRKHVEHLARRRRGRRCPWRSAGKTGRLRSHPVGQLAALHLVDLGGEIGILRAIAGEQRLPADRALRRRAPDAGGEMLADAVRHQELRVLRPAVGALGEPDLFLAQRLAVGRRRCRACAASRSRCGCRG